MKGISDDVVFMFTIAMLVSAIVGWGVIETLLWIISHISWV